jgi:ribosomal protein S18 acetylase RimI-like enzyme
MPTIVYTSSLDTIQVEQLRGGFFDGWPNPPSPEVHLRMLQGSYRVWLALDEETNQVVGFVQAISDGVLTAFIPSLEVLGAYQKQGIGTALMQRMLESLDHLYSVDLVCDEDVKPFYERLDMRSGTAMMSRNFDNQSGGSHLNKDEA